MIDEPFRTHVVPLFRPLVQLLARTGIRPNHVTLLAFALGVVAALLVAAGRIHFALVVWLVSRMGDAIDGALARETGEANAFGGFLDITLDMAAYGTMVLGFAVLHPELGHAWTAVLLGYVAVITTTLALSAAASAIGKKVSETDRTFQFTTGITEAGETSVMYVLWLLFPEHINWLVCVWILALTATALQRTHLAWRVLR